VQHGAVVVERKMTKYDGESYVPSRWKYREKNRQQAMEARLMH
jgi:hypothetical protein